MAVTVIPAALINGLNSDLPGQVVAQVTQDVHDSVSGRYLLVPQGAKLIGKYDSVVAYGQSRVRLIWTRLIMRDGSSVVLDNLPGADTQGYAGLKDGGDYHFRRLLRGIALSSLLGISSALATNNVAGGTGTGNVIIALGQLAADQAWIGRGIGTGLFNHALARSVGGAALIGGRALVVNAVDDEAAAFWRRRGFLPSRDDPLVLLRSIADITASLMAIHPQADDR